MTTPYHQKAKVKRELTDLQLFEFRKKHFGWCHKTPDFQGRGHLWVFTGWKLVEPDDWYGHRDTGNTIDRATWSCLECGLHMFMDCVWPNRWHDLEPIPGSLTWDCGGNKPCHVRFLEYFEEYGIREIMES
jgi:hypothetical protein